MEKKHSYITTKYTTIRHLMGAALLALMLTLSAATQAQSETIEIRSYEEFDDYIKNRPDKSYIITQNIDMGKMEGPIASFSGKLEAAIDTTTSMPYRLYNLHVPLFDTLTGKGTVCNLVINDVDINDEKSEEKIHTGAIARVANKSARIYNVGILEGSVSGINYTGGLVGLLDGEARVVNCYSYANIKGGSDVGGIVGYNNVATSSKKDNLKTMVFGCMFYGDITGGDDKAPIYNGKNIVNKDANGVSNFNYFRAEASYAKNLDIQTSNCALMAETRFLQRFEFFRHLLNGHREVAAWWVSGDASDTAQIMKWVLLPDSIGTAHPYPILKKWGKYPSVVNIDAEHAVVGKPRNQGGKLGELAVTIRMDDTNDATVPFHHPENATLNKTSLTLNITDKDTAHFNFNYYKVQLPYYNDIGTKNYNDNRVVTGWKIVSITGGTPGTFTASDSWGGYNFADRNCTNKDLYGTGGSNRIFNQGAYWDVPEGVTAITIEPYWAKAAYVADEYRDIVYNDKMSTQYNVANVGGGKWFTNDDSVTIMGSSQKVYKNISNASTALSINNNHTVYDYAIVLVGNYHQYNGISNSADVPYTIMSIDKDNDHEPDYSYILRFDGRTEFHPVRVDFINIPGLGMAQKSTGGKGSYNFGIMIPKRWYESTNTSLLRFTQFEYENSNRKETDAIIVHGGVMEQWVSYNQKGRSNKIPYIHVGGNVWFKEFHTGCHQDKNQTSGSSRFQPTKHSPISVTGGDFDEFYLTGLYVANVSLDNYGDNAECYINGGRFGTVCGAAMEGIGKTNGADNTGNITWQIQNADIHEFYAGGLNAAKPVTGNLSTTIVDSHVDIFCGGPKFGDMSANKTVVTNATNCTFGTFFGAGYGGNSYSRQAPKNHNNIVNFPHNDSQAGNDASWNAWLKRFYKQEYNSDYGGVSTQFNYQFLPMSGNADNVARIFVEYVKFSLATTRNVTSTLHNCTVTGNFYGGGSLGKVEGNVTSTLDSCTVHGNVFGAGYSAQLPTVEVDNIDGFKTEPWYYTDFGTYRTGEKGATTTYRWEHKETVNNTATAIDKEKHILYTTENLDELGTVAGNVVLKITGNTMVEGYVEDRQVGGVFGGGDESEVTGENKSVTIDIQQRPGSDKRYIYNVYGGGNKASVASSVIVNITDSSYIKNDVFGGGKGDKEHAPEVGGKVVVNIGANGTPYTGNATIGGSVYGCNDAAGTPKDDVRVNIYKTAHTTVNSYPSGITTVANLTTNASSQEYAIAAVYGGGNKASYTPNEDKSATVHVYGCENTIKDIYGGGNAADVGTKSVSANTNLVIEGGRFNRVFGGGNGEGDDNPGANIFGTATTTIHAGLIDQLFGGSNSKGDIKTTDLQILYDNENCGEIIGEVFGGANKAKISGAISTTIACGTGYFGDFYGGSNLADIGESADPTSSVSLIINGGTYNNIFGGSKGTSGTPANIYGTVTLDLHGGTIGNAFGGSNVNGNISGKITVNVEDKGDCDLLLTNVYGGGQDASYKPNLDESDNVITSPEVNIKHIKQSNSIRGSVFGGGKGETAKVTANPQVTIGDNTNTHYVTIGNNVFGGGDAAEVEGSTTVKMQNAHSSAAKLFGGGNEANVTGSVDIDITGGSISAGVYGGCNSDGSVGDIDVALTGGQIGEAGHEADVYGGGYGANTSTTGKIGITLDGTQVYGDIYGGSAFGSVNASTDNTTTIYINSNSLDGTVYGGGKGNLNTKAVSNGNVAVYINNENDKLKGLYGGANVNGQVVGNIAVAVEANVGAAGDGNRIDIFGGGLGELTETNGDVKVTIGANDKFPVIYGDIYGGSALGSVNNAASDITSVFFLNGTLNGNIYGGGLGEAGAANVSKGQVNGKIEVNISSDDQREEDCKIDLRNASIFGCNNTNGSPQSDVTVNIYKTAHNYSDYLTEDRYTASNGEDPYYAIGQVFGGGNLADYTGSGDITVNILGCNNTIRRVFGGGNAAAVTGATTNIAGGRFDYVFGGGNGESAPANIGSDGITLNVNGGIINNLFGGSNTSGTITGEIAVAVNKGTCEENIKQFFAGSNKVDIGTAQSRVSLNTTIACGTVFGDVYGGCNLANVYGDVTLTINGGTIENVFGGSKGSNTAPVAAADIHGDVTLNIYGGAIGNAFGGSNYNGNITGAVAVNLDWSQSECAGKSINNIYGASNLTPYTPTNQGSSPSVNIKHGTVSHSVYGGGKGAPAIANSNPTVTIGDNTETHEAVVEEFVYGGGDAAEVNGNTTVEMKNANSSVSKLFGGGANAGVTGNTSITLTNGLVKDGIFGGSDTTGTIGGNTVIALNGGNVGTSDYPAHYDICGGGWGLPTRVGGNVSVTLNGSSVYSDIYGGSYYGDVNTNSSNTTTINLTSGSIDGNVYGGGFGDKRDNAYALVNGAVTVNAIGVMVSGDIFGCNNDNGAPQSTVKVNFSGGSARSVLGGGNLADYEGTPEINISGGVVSQRVIGGGYAASVGGSNITITDGTIATDNSENDRGVYGGCYTSGDVTNNAIVSITGGTIGNSTTTSSVFGGGFGKKTSVGNNVEVILNSASATVWGDVYGGSALGNVNGNLSDESKHTYVTLTAGTVKGNAYGGGLGNNGSTGVADDPETPEDESLDLDIQAAAKVNGAVTITLEGATVDGSVFGCNNVYGAPQNNVTVNVTSGTTTNVFGGGNLAGASVVPHVNISGGTIDTVFGGGNEAGVGGSVVNMTGGTASGGVYGGCNTSGTVDGNISVNTTGGAIGVNNSNYYDGVFGGGYGSSTASTGNVTVTVGGATVYGDVYGGSALGSVNDAEADITKVTLSSGTVGGNIYGGGLGEAGAENAVKGQVNGQVEVQVNGGTATNVFGCNNTNGAPQSSVKVVIEETTPGAMNIHNVYGGGNLATYAYHGSSNGSPLVNVKSGTVANVFGGGLGNSAVVTGRPIVTIEGTGTVGKLDDSDNLISNTGEVYGGGDAAAVEGNTAVKLKGGATVRGNVFGGGNEGAVSGNSSVSIED